MELPGARPFKPRGDKLAVAADAYLSNHADEWGERHRDGSKALIRMHARALADVPVSRITTEQIVNVLRPIWKGAANRKGNRLRRLIEAILTAKRVEPNPAIWARLRELLSKKIPAVEPRAAMAAETDECPFGQAVFFEQLIDHLEIATPRQVDRILTF